jgi:hypothetical protein
MTMNEAGVSRRALAAGVVWAAPVVTAAFAAPTFAASCMSCADWFTTITTVAPLLSNPLVATLTSPNCTRDAFTVTLTRAPEPTGGFEGRFVISDGTTTQKSANGGTSVSFSYASGITAGTTITFTSTGKTINGMTVTCG